MNSRILAARIVHDLSLSAWFGGELMGAVGLNGAAAQLSDPRQRSRAANAGWRRFSPVLLGSVAAHLASGSILVKEDKDRLKSQPEFARASAIKTALTGAALAGTAYQQVLGRRMAKGGDQPITGATQPSSDTDPAQASAQRQLNVLQFLIPALTGSAWIVHSANGELARPAQQAQGLVSQVIGTASGDARPPLALAAVAGAGLLALRRRRSRSLPESMTTSYPPPTPLPPVTTTETVVPGPSVTGGYAGTTTGTPTSTSTPTSTGTPTSTSTAPPLSTGIDLDAADRGAADRSDADRTL